jgi:hypothetical protein
MHVGSTVLSVVVEGALDRDCLLVPSFAYLARRHHTHARFLDFHQFLLPPVPSEYPSRASQSFLITFAPIPLLEAPQVIPAQPDGTSSRQ